MKYDTLDNLNVAWHRNFKKWDQVDPPRFSTILSYTDFIDWKTFIYDKLVQDMQARYDAIRKADRTHLITAHAVGASLFQSPHVGAGATDDFLMAKPLDYYGVSIYPKHNNPQYAWSVTTLRTVMDFIRSANREKGGWYVGELQGGLGTVALQVSDPVTSDDHRIWAWSAIAKGAKGVNIYAYYPMSSGYEAGGYGLINLDGSLTQRAKDAGQIAQIVDRHQQLFLESTPVKAEIGIVYNPLAQMVGGMQRNDYPAALSQSLIGYFQTFANHNIPVDFIHREHLEKKELSQYKLIIVPYPIMFTREAAAGLKDFVANGGYVVAEARTAWNDERGYASEVIPGLGLHKIFGVKEKEVRMRENIDFTIVNHEHPSMQGIKKEDKLKGALYSQALSILEGMDVKVLATDMHGAPAIVNNTFGKGEAMLIGTYMGMANFQKTDAVIDKFFVNLLDWAKIKRPFTTSLDGRTENQVEVRLQNTKDGYLLFLINHSDKEEAIKVSLPSVANDRLEMKNIINGEAKPLIADNNIATISTQLGAKDVGVFKISPSTNR